MGEVGVQVVVTFLAVLVSLVVLFFVVRGAILSALTEDRRRVEQTRRAAEWKASGK